MTRLTHVVRAGLAAAVAVLAACGLEPDSSSNAGRAVACPLVEGGAGTDIVCGEPPRCSYTYTQWSACVGPLGGQYKTRSVVSATPAGCQGSPSTSTSCSTWIGVIPSSFACGAAASADVPDVTPVTLLMDTEDLTRNSGFTGWVGATELTINNDVLFRLCRVNGLLFKPLIDTAVSPNGPQYAKDYMAVQLGTDCPNGSISVARNFDTEDWNNITRMLYGDLSPGFVTADKNVYLRLCLFRIAAPPVTRMDQFPALGFPYGVFAGADSDAWKLATGTILVDDENENPMSFFDYGALTDWYAYHNIIDGHPHIYSGGTSMKTASVRTW